MEAATSSKNLRCIVVTPEKAMLDLTAEYVSIPMYDGELGVLPGRAPLIGRLGYGELRIRHGGHIDRYFIDGGFAQVRANVVTVLTPRAIPANQIDRAAVAGALAEARKTATAEAQEAQLKAQERARAQLRVATRGTGTPAPTAHA
jgi:F-type H+-transporting ATPase subunit epsilon